MPDFIAALVAASVFCLGLGLLDALTRLTGPLLPVTVDEGSLLQVGGALLLAGLAWRRAVRPPLA